MPEKNLAIIGASYLQLPLILKAKEMGYTTHVFAWASGDVGEKAADYFYPISIVEKEQIADQCRRIGICGVCSIASDLAAITVNYTASELGLTGNSMECTQKSTNKYAMRKAFAENGDPSPFSLPVNSDTDLDELEFVFPVIVKPTDRSGSRGITKVESRGMLEHAVQAACKESFEKEALVEEYAGGTEYSLEGISWKGKHRILAMTLKQTTGAPHFIETGHIEPAPVSRKTFEKACRTVVHALDTLGIEYGASHSEIKISDDGEIKIIEIGGRMGGDCIGSDLVRLTTGIDYVGAVIQISCGQEPDLSPAGPGIPAGVRYIFTTEDERELDRFRRDHPDRFIRLVYLDRELLDKTTNSSDRAGCYLYRMMKTDESGTNPEQ